MYCLDLKRIFITLCWSRWLDYQSSAEAKLAIVFIDFFLLSMSSAFHPLRGKCVDQNVNYLLNSECNWRCLSAHLLYLCSVSTTQKGHMRSINHHITQGSRYIGPGSLRAAPRVVFASKAGQC